jgi:hypothetical protein
MPTLLPHGQPSVAPSPLLLLGGIIGGRFSGGNQCGLGREISFYFKDVDDKLI